MYDYIIVQLAENWGGPYKYVRADLMHISQDLPPRKIAKLIIEWPPLSL